MAKTALIDADVIAVRSAAIAERDNASEFIAIDAACAMIIKWSWDMDPLLCISDGRNFRREIFPEYKAKRGPKPKHTAAIYEYMKGHYNYCQWDGLEADDVMGLLGTYHDDAVIVTIDKDLLCVPGWHWNPDKDDEPYYLNADKARYNELVQWASGDSTDNIPGLKGVGPKRAALLADQGEKAIRDAYGDPERAELMHRLIHILRVNSPYLETHHAELAATFTT